MTQRHEVSQYCWKSGTNRLLDAELTEIFNLQNNNNKKSNVYEAEITYRYRSMHFNHVFSGGYEVGYYSYLWAEVLDADAFEAFVENGIFDKATADAFRTNILEAGSSEDPMKLYIQFRGAEPNPEALIRGRGLK